MATQVGNVIFQISADLKDVQGQLRTLEGNFNASFSKIKSLAGTALGSLGIGLSVTGLVAFGRSVVDLGDKLSDLSDQTGISIATLGGFRVVAEQNRTNIEDMATAILRAQKNLGQMDADGEGAARTLKNLGLNVRDLQTASPDEFFEKFATALAGVSNQNERAAIAVQVFGREGARANAAILQWVNEGMTKLDLATANAYKRLGDLRDGFVRLSATIFDTTAQAFDSFITDLENVSRLIQLNLGLFRQFGASGALIGAVVPNPGTPGLQDVIQQSLIKKPNPFQGLAVPKAAGAKDTGVEDFFANLQKQIEQIDLEFTKLRDGDQIAKEIALDLQFADFNQKRLAEGKPIASIEEFRKYKEVIVAANAALEKLKATRELIDLRQGLAVKAIDTSTPLGKEQERVAQIEVDFAKTAKKLDELGKQAGQTQEEIAANVALAWRGAIGEINKTRDDAAKQLQDLRQQLQLGAMDTTTPQGKENQRVAGIEIDYAKTVAKIQELGVAAGRSQEQISEDITLAWRKSLNEIRTTTDEVTEFERRAMERAFDEMTNLTKDVLDGNVKSWADFGSRVKKIIDEIASEWLTLQLKSAIFGQDFGKAGAPVGGAAKSIGDFFSNAFSTVTKFFGFHEGGLVTAGGGYSTFSREMPAALAYIAPRYHTGNIPGLRSDEVLGVLQQGETVVPKGMKLGAMGGGNYINNFYLSNNSFAERRSQGQVLAKLASSVKIAQQRNS